jgi:putative transposase
MPRGKRLDVAGVAQHVVQRGNDRQACFFRDDDYARYLGILREAGLRFGCCVHAYVLMTNHVHLLLTPARAGGVAQVMQALGRTYVRHVNDTLGRTGTLWEGRYKSCLVDSERYVLACYRYIELNPVRAGMVADAAGYAWSSHGYNALGQPDPLVRPHATYLQIAASDKARRAHYRAWVAEGISADELHCLRLYSQRQRALGSDRFQQQIERQLARRVAIGLPGRPRNPRPANL